MHGYHRFDLRPGALTPGELVEVVVVPGEMDALAHRPVGLPRHQGAAPDRHLAGPEEDVLSGQLPQGRELERPARETDGPGSLT